MSDSGPRSTPKPSEGSPVSARLTSAFSETPGTVISLLLVLAVAVLVLTGCLGDSRYDHGYQFCTVTKGDYRFTVEMRRVRHSDSTLGLTLLARVCSSAKEVLGGGR